MYICTSKPGQLISFLFLSMTVCIFVQTQHVNTSLSARLRHTVPVTVTGNSVHLCHSVTQMHTCLTPSPGGRAGGSAGGLLYVANDAAWDQQRKHFVTTAVNVFMLA